MGLICLYCNNYFNTPFSVLLPLSTSTVQPHLESVMLRLTSPYFPCNLTTFTCPYAVAYMSGVQLYLVSAASGLTFSLSTSSSTTAQCPPLAACSTAAPPYVFLTILVLISLLQVSNITFTNPLCPCFTVPVSSIQEYLLSAMSRTILSCSHSDFMIFL